MSVWLKITWVAAIRVPELSISLPHALTVQDLHVAVEDRIVRLATAIEARERLDVADDLVADSRERRGTGIVWLLCIGDLEEQAEVALAFVEFLGDVALDLEAIRHVITGVKWATANLEIAADVEAQRVVDRAAITEINLGLVEVHAFFEADEAAFGLAGVADEVDDRARRLRRIGRGTAAAHGFDAGGRGIKMSPVIIVAELDVAKQDGGQAIFLKLDEGRAAGCDGKAAHGDVRVTTGSGGARNLNAWNQAKRF